MKKINWKLALKAIARAIFWLAVVAFFALVAFALARIALVA